MRVSLLILSCLVPSWTLGAPSEPIATVVVDTQRPGPKISPTMWGIFFEDINFGADGGLSAELIKNRAFEFPDPMMGWSRSEGVTEGASIGDTDPINASTPHYL